MCVMIGVGLFGVKTVKETDYWTHYQSHIIKLIKKFVCVCVCVCGGDTSSLVTSNYTLLPLNECFKFRTWKSTINFCRKIIIDFYAMQIIFISYYYSYYIKKIHKKIQLQF